ncbi:M23 family metallopeptidase [Polymorphum gilvum]|uniref:Putative transmembrane peptidase family protein n=1 Tax=Polymorphum gilvum (strain LMG 25793 / CGMCC 1.9160 / SL003B-26A1) TaxID=991905 RepID=F2IXG1_POLGS|nr:M23 family metallopeptidase [Polymorphum gilvum]ADZ70479.1 Putative transmembrane peptidase family protein [Polymorphum gilvum SL003B-26A1]
MSDNTSSPRKSFGKRGGFHHVTITRGNTSRTFVIRPWIMGTAAVVLILFLGGYLSAAAYLFLRDDLLGARAAQQAEIESAYQARIAHLRAEIDRLTSRQIVDRASVETLVESLIARQDALSDRHSKVASLVERAARSGLRVAIDNPVPPSKPVFAQGTLQNPAAGDASAIGGEPAPIANPLPALGLRGTSSVVPLDHAPSAATTVDEGKLSQVEDTLKRMYSESAAALDALAVAAEQHIDTIVEATAPLGIRLPALSDASVGANVGGPYIPLPAFTFDERIQRAERALAALESLKTAARRLPLTRPIANVEVSSDYGPRLDPFLRTLAMHTGIDFKANYGTAVRAAAGGTVIAADRQGGYGKMVEIRHAGDVVTRYAHLSQIKVGEGDVVEPGDIVGLVGSTGRSTGPHLHYEIRLDGEAVDPFDFVVAGDHLAPILAN